jgi:hypothetical protein
LLAAALTLAGAVGPSVALAAPESPAVGQALRSIIERYSADDAKQAKQAAADAFFEFEGSTLDRDLAARAPALYRQLEGEWMRLLAAMDGGRSEEQVRAQGEQVLALLERGGAQAADGGGSVFVDSLLIILREGFEAILIVSALAAYLGRIGERSRAPYSLRRSGARRRRERPPLDCGAQRSRALRRGAGCARRLDDSARHRCSLLGLVLARVEGRGRSLAGVRQEPSRPRRRTRGALRPGLPLVRGRVP